MPKNAAELHPHDPAWLTRASEQLEAIARALTGIHDVDVAIYDHIGSTSVPGLRAKPFIDLQVRLLPMPDIAELTARLGPLGYAQAHGSRPDSPGVYRDIPRGDEAVPHDVWDKSIFTNDDVPAILHIRRADSPWGRYTVWFRDWLLARPHERERYEDLKVRLSEANAGKPDYDDYTRAKTVFFDEVQASFTAWARTTGRI